MSLQLHGGTELLTEDVDELKAERFKTMPGYCVGKAHAIVAHLQLKLPVWLAAKRHPDVAPLPMGKGVLETVRDEFMGEERAGHRGIDANGDVLDGGG